jgi:hypothetical protein
MGILSEDYIARFNKLSGVITEASIHDITVNSFLNDNFITKFINGNITSDSDMFLWDYMKDNFEVTYGNPQFNELEKETKKNSSYREYVKNELTERLRNSIENIKSMIDDSGEITIYRVMAVDENWISHLETQGSHLGIYWTWSESGGGLLGSFSVEKTKEAAITAKVNEKYIDWNTSLYQNMVLEVESEITLFKNTPLKIIGIEFDDLGSPYSIYKTSKPMDISRIQNKTFYA